jgi:hypothetical protein
MICGPLLAPKPDVGMLLNGSEVHLRYLEHMADLSMLADPSHGKVTAHSESGHHRDAIGDANVRTQRRILPPKEIMKSCKLGRS